MEEGNIIIGEIEVGWLWIAVSVCFPTPHQSFDKFLHSIGVKQHTLLADVGKPWVFQIIVDVHSRSLGQGVEVINTNDTD